MHQQAKKESKNNNLIISMENNKEKKKKSNTKENIIDFFEKLKEYEAMLEKEALKCNHRSTIIKDNFKLILEEIKFKYENTMNVYDYLLKFFRQILTLSSTGFLGIIAIKEDLIQNPHIVKTILLITMFTSGFSIIFLLFKKIKYAEEMDKIVNDRIKTIQELTNLEDDVVIRNSNIQEKIDECREKLSEKIKDILN